MKRVTKIIQWLIPVTFLACFTGCLLSLPETLDEFLRAAIFSFLFWGSMFVGALVEAFEE
jgi:Na+-translocating ferredoxin:NAD+ oxidoreductase RnfD subunit